MEDLQDALDEQGGATQAQADLNKKREAEIGKLRRDVEEANVQHEQAISSMRSKNQQALAEVQEELETFKKSKAK